MSKTPKKPVVKMSLRIGTCRVYFSDRAVNCPLCGARVPAGVRHECSIDTTGPSKKGQS